MILSEREVKAIRECLTKIELKDAKGMNRYFATNQIRNIRQILVKAERREKNALL